MYRYQSTKYELFSAAKIAKVAEYQRKTDFEHTSDICVPLSL